MTVQDLAGLQTVFAPAKRLLPAWGLALGVTALGLGVGSPALLSAAETAAFLKISPGARPIAMGDAFTAIADDMNALVWNPAGLASMRRPEAAFMHAELFEETRYDFIGYAHPLGRSEGLSTLGFGLARLSQGAIQGRDANRRPTGSFEASDTAVHLAYSRRFFRGGPMFGISGKYLQSTLADVTARTFAADIGVMGAVFVGPKPVFLGASVLNLGPGMKYLETTEDLPLTLAFGGGIRILGAVLLAADYRLRPNSGKTEFGLGTEYTLLPSLSLRAGYASRLASIGSASDGAAGGMQGLGMGLGLRIGKAMLDYSFAPAGELGGAQRVSLSMRFGAKTPAARNPSKLRRSSFRSQYVW